MLWLHLASTVDFHLALHNKKQTNKKNRQTKKCSKTFSHSHVEIKQHLYLENVTIHLTLSSNSDHCVNWVCVFCSSVQQQKRKKRE